MDLSGINPKTFFDKYLKLEHLSGDEYRALCPFHSDETEPNLTVNVVKGVYQCFACHATGNIVDFYKKFTLKSARDFAVEFGISQINLKVIEDFIGNLRRNNKLLEYLKTNRGLDDKIIARFGIGFDGKTRRYTIPIFDRYGVLVNIRKYSCDPEHKGWKMVSFKKGYGKLALYGEKNLGKEKEIIICAGEWDRILLEQQGFISMCVTGGEGCWNDQWDVKDKFISIIYDCDDPGRLGARRVAEKIFKVNKVKIIKLGLEKGEDITDWFVKYKKTADELKKLIEATDLYSSKDVEYAKTSIALASESGYYNKNITFRTVVAGKNLSPYQIPKMVELQCDKHNKLSKCAVCKLKDDGSYKLDFNDRELVLELIDISKSQLIGVVKQYVNIPKCGLYRIVKEEKRNVEEIKLIPEIEFSDLDDDSEYVVRKAYLLDDKIQTNRVYIVYGTTLPDPKNQQVVHVFDKVVPARDNIEEFQLDDKIKKQLKKFQCGKLSIKEKLDEIYKDFSLNITNIYHREDLLLALDLIWHTCLSFNFLGKRVAKGWGELFILGDSRTGKTESIKAILQHYRCGERISAENTSIAGLIAGLQQTQQRWTLMWGKIPLNDKRLLIIDEAGQLTHEDFSRLSDIRSSGIAEVVKIQTQKTKARTRLIVIANPIKRRLIEYSYGILGAKEIIGQNEDVARFDLIISVSDVDVPSSEINKRITETVEHKYDSASCHSRVMFMWSRKLNEITFTKEAEDRILEVSKEFAQTFTNVIPLVQGAEIRIKLARLSVSLAGMLNSVDETGEKIVVRKEHVDYLRVSMLKFYNKAGLDYYAFSQQRKKEATIVDESYLIRLIANNTTVIELLLDNNRYTLEDFETFFGVDKLHAKEIRTKLLGIHAIKKYNSTYMKTPAFIGFLKTRKRQIERKDDEEDV